MWLSSFILIVAGVFLTYEATNDSAILNLDSYLSWIRTKTGLGKRILLDKKAHLTGKFEIHEIPKSELQHEFNQIAGQSADCIELIRKELTAASLIRKVISNTGYPFLIEFGVNYNSLMDRIILSQWFRNPYFNKRLSEFPFLNGRITANFFPNRFAKYLSFLLFPIWLLILFYLWIKVQRLKRNLHQVKELSFGIVNLLNRTGFKSDSPDM
jgi:hypothetical protein